MRQLEPAPQPPSLASMSASARSSSDKLLAQRYKSSDDRHTQTVIKSLSGGIDSKTLMSRHASRDMLRRSSPVNAIQPVSTSSPNDASNDDSEESPVVSTRSPMVRHRVKRCDRFHHFLFFVFCFLFLFFFVFRHLRSPCRHRRVSLSIGFFIR